VPRPKGSKTLSGFHWKVGKAICFAKLEIIHIFADSSMIALREFQDGMKWEAERAGIHSEEELSKLVKEIRKEPWEKKYADHDWY